MAAGIAHRRGETIDVRHDVARDRRLAHFAGRHEIILHVDDDERRLGGIENVARMGLAALGDRLGDLGLGQRKFVHGTPPLGMS